ncbi:MAG: hypothetical protein KAR13_18110 [Desulfobulbaceae bacterium]|nr:hypothetical protein [Desulfobulbaceae bacterium]
MKKNRVALAGETALFRYGVIADFVYPPPEGPKGLYQQIKKKAEQVYTIPGSNRIRVEEETIRGEFLNNYRGVGQ